MGAQQAGHLLAPGLDDMESDFQKKKSTSIYD
jgi:hypothetical protein